MTKYKAIIIGAGPAGQSCAVRISQLGGKVAIIERDYIGGICTNWGCTPSKSMIESAKVAKVVGEASKYGVNVENAKIDFSAVAGRRDKVVLKTRESITDLLNHHQVDIFFGEAFIDAPGQVTVKGGKLDIDGQTMHYDGQEIKIEAENIVIATGSKPLIPGFIDESDPSIVNSNRLISINELPERLTIVGGGVIGLEFATIFSNLGSKVIIVELLDRVLAAMDPEISELITEKMQEKGVEIYTGHKVLSINNGLLQAENQETGEVISIESPNTLIAIGRQAVIHPDIYKNLGIEFTRKGVEVNDHLQTNVQGIWAVGDATGKSILAHVGVQQGVVCGENIMASPPDQLREMDYEVIPAVIYSLPEIVGVGTVPEDLNSVEVYKIPFTANLRANIEEQNEGFFKIWVKDYRVVAVQAIGYIVSEIIQEIANMIALKTDIREVAEIIHAHPSYAEITKSVFEHALGKAVDFYL
jgi:dihydrolipoamide dehydrogenase